MITKEIARHMLAYPPTRAKFYHFTPKNQRQTESLKDKQIDTIKF